MCEALRSISLRPEPPPAGERISTRPPAPRRRTLWPFGRRPASSDRVEVHEVIALDRILAKTALQSQQGGFLL